MDQQLRRLDRLAASGDREAENRAARLRCRLGEHTWKDIPYMSPSGRIQYKMFMYPLVCRFCGYKEGPQFELLDEYFFDYSSTEIKLMESAYAHGFLTSTTVTTSPDYVEEEEDPRKGSPPPYTWHPTKKRPWQKAGYRKRIKARRKRSRK